MSKRGQNALRGAGVSLAGFTLLVMCGGVACAPVNASQSAGHGGPHVLASDTSTRENPLPFWGSIDCASQTRYRNVRKGGDKHPIATGRPQRNKRFRRLTVFDGDDFYGERCELGRNYSGTDAGPTVFYRQGSHLVTWISIRLPRSLVTDAPTWQTVMQMKQTQPYDSDVDSQGTPGTPILDLEVMKGEWLLLHPNRAADAPCHKDDSTGICWRAPARKGVWTRFSFDVVYSNNPAIGSIKVSADLNGDNDYKDHGELVPRIHLATLRTESAPESTVAGVDGLAVGDPIPSHLRAGIYHDPA